MSAEITKVDAKSPAARAGIRAGDVLLKIDGHTIADVLDYKFYSYDADITVTLAERSVRVRKGEGEDMGLTFTSYLMDSAKRCGNKCVFCFIDQMPPGMRETLYFKDDDARMSFLMGNYISLTNLSEQDVERIIRMRLSPLNISVQVTEPELRCKMLGNPKAGQCMDILARFAQADLMINCQIVVCPGLNDGDVLRKSLRELVAYAPAVGSVSVVPVGLTKYREGLYPLVAVDEEKAGEIIDIVDEIGEQCLEKHYSRIVYCGDELYIKAHRPLPNSDYYEDYPQLENGIGLMRLMKEEFSDALDSVKADVKVKPFTVATGTSAAPYIKNLIDELVKKCDNVIDYRVVAVKNKFFGESVNVAGLVTGGDLVDALKSAKCSTRVLIPGVMLRHKTNVFLDDITLSEAETAAGVSITPVENDGQALLNEICR